MKTTRLIFAAAMLLFGSSLYAGNLVQNRNVDIRFVGFCDGLRLVINQSTQLVTGSHLGCISGPLVGTVGALANTGAGVSVTTDYQGSGPFLIHLDDNPARWTIYRTNGTVVNSGSWAVGAPALGSASAAGD